ncbi:MAG TPA: Smr/MutS family protein [Candidatus Binatia bacterium]
MALPDPVRIARLAQLGDRTLAGLDWPFVVEMLASCARTPAGRRAARSVALRSDIDAITESFDEIDELRTLEERGLGSPPVSGAEEITDMLVRAARGEVLDLEDIAIVRSTLASLVALQDFLAANRNAAPVLARVGTAAIVDRALSRSFESALDEHGALSATTYPVLGELRRRIAGLERSIRDTLEGILESAEYADILQDRYVTTRGDRFVVPVKAHAKGLGLGIVHDASRTERTVFVEPAAIVPSGNQKRMAEAALRDEERRIRAELSAAAGACAEPLGIALDAGARIDLACARDQLARRLQATRPEVGRDGVLRLFAARHPVLALSMTTVVASDLVLEPRRPVLVLTGPNAGGKTIAMKTIGLCALLVRAGCFVPARDGSRVDVFDPVLADIGDMQTVHEGLSSFSAHLSTLAAMLEAAGPGSLLLLDEIASGTDPAQGGALARAVIERLADVGARIVATTHYTQVKTMHSGDARIQVSALEYRDAKPTYRVVPGEVGESHALAAAARLGLDPSLLERARELMDQGERATLEALEALAEERSRLGTQFREAQERARAIAQREAALGERESEIQGRARELEKKAAAATLRRLDEAEAEVRRRLDALRGEADERRAAEARQAIRAAREAAVGAGQAREAVSRPAQVGDHVRVIGVGVSGDVVEAGLETLEIRVGSMTVRARRGEVEIIVPERAPARAASRGGRAQTRGRDVARGAASSHHDENGGSDWRERAIRSASNTLDLRGARVEEALEKLQDFLDRAMLDSRDFVFVLHGHGTGAMKSAVRRALSSSPYVRESAPASDDQGGDALTVSRLRD